MLIAEDIFYVHERETGYNKNALNYCSATQVPEIYQRVNNSADIESSKKISVNVSLRSCHSRAQKSLEFRAHPYNWPS
jgi:hypothetical protein